jgi:hypothetical protein
VRVRRPELLFAVGTIIAGAAIVWVVVDVPLDTGIRVNATILHCYGTGKGRSPYACRVQLDGTNATFIVHPPGSGSEDGKPVKLALMRRSISGLRFHKIVADDG